jgi:hypothetical protein
MNKFRPQEFNKRWALKHFRKTGHTVGEYNWQGRTRYYRDCDRNKEHQIRVQAHLHYLGSHAPAPIRKRWHIVEQQYLMKRSPMYASMRYLNNRSGWL